jgi:hypothetical protein
MIPETHWLMQSLAEWPQLADLPLEVARDAIRDAIRSLTPEQRIRLWYDWPRHARPEQLAPGEDGSVRWTPFVRQPEPVLKV